jgi:riboflavin kinase
LNQRTFTIEGTVFQGQGVGNCYISLPWVKHQIQQKMGFEPYHGTLNIQLEKEDAETLSHMLKRLRPVEITPKPGFLEASCFHALINRVIQGAVIIPKKLDYPSDIIEIIAPMPLREEIPLEDGDKVTITILLPT